MRRWQDGDREPFAALNADPHTMRFFPATLDRAASDAMIDRLEERFEAQGFGLWALEIAHTGQFIGFTGLNPMPDDVPGAGGMEVGWRLARAAWHHGYATEAARAALDVAFGSLGMAEVYSMTAVLNEPSQAVMRRLGLTEFARWDHPRIPESSPLRPSVTYRLIRDNADAHERGTPRRTGTDMRQINPLCTDQTDQPAVAKGAAVASNGGSRAASPSRPAVVDPYGPTRSRLGGHAPDGLRPRRLRHTQGACPARAPSRYSYHSGWPGCETSMRALSTVVSIDRCTA
jgi:RimJ/RimL family protein N-acetyltransferase